MTFLRLNFCSSYIFWITLGVKWNSNELMHILQDQDKEIIEAIIVITEHY